MLFHVSKLLGRINPHGAFEQQLPRWTAWVNLFRPISLDCVDPLTVEVLVIPIGISSVHSELVLYHDIESKAVAGVSSFSVQ